MAKIAIDVALLPPEEVMDKAIRLNQSFGPKFDLNKSDRLPHLTLCQAIINISDLEEAKNRLAELAKKFRALKLDAKMVNDPDSFFRITPRNAIFNLHKAIMEELEDLVSYDAKEEYFLDPEVRERSLGWVSNFPRDGAFDNFDPHISLGVEEKIQDENPISFTADRLAICHLGNFNTCRKILYETKLA